MSRSIPIIFIAGLAGLSQLPVARHTPSLWWTLVATAVALTGWVAFLAARGPAPSVTASARPQHYVQACAQITIISYWGWYWREVYHAAHLIAAQLLFAYAFDILLSWSRRCAYTVGFAPIPVIFSINLFLWFKPDWFYFQFILIAIGFAAKEFIQWEKDGRQVHIFNPSSFPLGLFSLGLLLTGTTHLTWGQEIATTLNHAPQIYLLIFLVSLPGQLLFGVTTMTMSAVVTMYLFGLVYYWAAGTYYCVDSYIPIAVFLGMHLLFTDPSTAPRTEQGRILFGVVYALSVTALYGVLGAFGLPRFYDKLLAVPVMNLLIQIIDGTTRIPLMQRFDPSRLGPAITGARRNVAYVSIWTVTFLALSAAQGVGDTHRGNQVLFWKRACADDLPNGCRHFGVMVSTFCNNGSGWACNEYGILLQPERRPELASQAFSRACDLGFEAGCDNRGLTRAREPVTAPPALDDYEIILRDGRRPLPPLPPLEIYQRACAEGFTDACRLACTMGDRRLCAEP